jgi:uncharacterized protein YabN with tetrapyrrole methylase and pyrophosphatase domain
MNTISADELISQIKSSIARFEKIEGKPWGVEGAVIELAKQVGQLSTLVMNEEDYYFPDREKLDSKYESSKDKIADELQDILFAIVRIADLYDIDIVSSATKTREVEDKFLKSKGV